MERKMNDKRTVEWQKENEGKKTETTKKNDGNVTKWETWYYLASFGVEFCSFLLLLYRPPVTVAINNSQPLVYTFIPHLFEILVSKMFPCKDITLNSSFFNITIPSQRLVTTSASLRTQTGLHCLILQVLNIKSLFPNCLIQSLSLLYVVI